MHILACFIALLVFVHPVPAHAEERGTADQLLAALLAMNDAQCRKTVDADARQLEAQGKLALAYALRSADKFACECMPESIRRLRAAMPAAERQQVLTESEMIKKYEARLTYQCGAAMLRETYGGDCAKRLHSPKRNPVAYCACMASALTALPDAVLGDMGHAVADYLPLAAEAKKRGRPVPVKPAPLQALAQLDTQCAAK